MLRQQTPAPEEVNVASLDADNCVFNTFYRDLNDPETVIKANPSLIVYLKQIMPVKTTVHNIMMNGSLRQNKMCDDGNSANNKTKSYFAELCVLHAHLANYISGIMLDKFLTPDIIVKQPRGYTFNKALGIIQDQKAHPFVTEDHSKISLIYLQMHHIALKYPQSKINFNFFDDKSEILLYMHFIFVAHPELIPANLKLVLHPYDATQPIKAYKPIQGCGPIDAYHAQGFVDLLKNCCSGDKIGSKLEIEEVKKNLNIEAFKLKRNLNYTVKIVESVKEEKTSAEQSEKSPSLVSWLSGSIVNNIYNYFSFTNKSAQVVPAAKIINNIEFKP